MKSTGICLLNWDEALPWLSKQLPLVSDELAILTLYCHHDDVGEVRPEETMFPAIDVQKRHVILRGYMWQLGEKEVSASAREKSVSTANTLVLAFTLWRDECGEATWSAASSSLVKTVFNLLPNIDTKKNVLQVWGRSYRDDYARVSPEQAKSAQFHARVFADEVEVFLRSSTGPIYMTPKTESHLSHADWGLIWMNDKYEADICATRATEHSGLARSKAKFALRVRSMVLQQVTKELRPDAAVDSQVAVSKLYKLRPLPVGITNEQIVAWAKSQEWQIRVIKKLGQDAALVGCAVEPPHKYLSLNGTLVLISPIQSNKRQNVVTPIVAGPKPVATKPARSDSSVVPLKSDPWQEYRNTHAIPAPSQKSVDPPTASKFAAIETRLAQFETHMQSFQAQTDVLVKNMESQNQFNKVAEGRMAAIESRFEHMPAAIENAIVKAMSSQERKLDSKFDALMSALSSKSKRDAASVEVHSDEDMETTPVKPPPAKR